MTVAQRIENVHRRLEPDASTFVGVIVSVYRNEDTLGVLGAQRVPLTLGVRGLPVQQFLRAWRSIGHEFIATGALPSQL